MIMSEQCTVKIDDFFPEFVPKWNNAEECPNCRKLGMCKWEVSATARCCQNCKFIEERNK